MADSRDDDPPFLPFLGVPLFQRRPTAHLSSRARTELLPHVFGLLEALEEQHACSLGVLSGFLVQCALVIERDRRET